MMKRSLIAGATAVGVLFAALVTPATVAASAQISLSPEIDCGITVWSEVEAATVAEACDKDIEVAGATGDSVRLFAEPDGGMRMEAAVEDSVWWRNAAARTLLSPDGPAEYGWEGDRWVGYCDPAEYTGCATAGTQRAVWQFDGFDILAELEPEDVTSATFIVNGETAWLDDAGCTANSLEIYDVPLVSPATDWTSTVAWTADKRVGERSFYAPGCDQQPQYTGYFSFDATQLAVDAARDDRTSVAVGVRAADETCMTCGWNMLRQHAILRINFNRAPLAPRDLQIGFLYSKVACTGETVLRTIMPFIRPDIVDPDGTSSSNWVKTAAYRIARTDNPDTTLWEGTTTAVSSNSGHHAEVPRGVLEDGGRYTLTVFGTDNHGLTGPSTSCVFRVDTVPPDAPTVAPILGGEAFYPTGALRGGVGIPGAFLLTSDSGDVVAYEYIVNNQSMPTRVTAGKNTVLLAAPSSTGANKLSVRAVDAAGNISGLVTYEFEASKSAFFVPTPPAITVTGPTAHTVGDAPPTASVTLSADAMTPYGAVTVTSGSTVVGSAVFDERTEELELDASALGTGTKTLTYTYRAVPEAPEWSTSRTMTISLPAFTALRQPSVSGTPQVGKTLTALRGPWTPSPTANKYQWRLDGRSVSGATGQTWKVPAAAMGKTVSVAITGSKTGYATKTLVSPATAAVKAGVFVAPAPTITGSARVGATLQVIRGVWTPQPSTVKYQWKVAGRPVAGATRSTFTVPSSARGKRVAVVVTGSLAGYTTKSVSRSMTSVIR
jgi:hypothetical protein